jgi:adenylosuccinate synthase
VDGVIVISGPIAVGKSSFVKALVERCGATKVGTRDYILRQTGCANERGALQEAGDALDAKTGGTWVADSVVEAAANAASEAVLLVDSARIAAQVRELRARFPGKIFHVHLHAGPDELERRYLNRDPELNEFSTYAEASAHGTEAQVGTLAGIANLVLDADHADLETLAVTAMAVRSTPVQDIRPMVDVIVGGQYGSEGKGNVCAHIARNYGALLRIGGPNAGHKVAHPKYNYVQLPSGTGSNPEAMILIGAGSTIWLPQLMREMMDHQLPPERLAIDPQAMVIDDEDRRAESIGLISIGTTGQGVGAASGRKILNRGSIPLYGPPVILARNVKQLLPYVRDVRAELDRLYRQGTFVLLEGTQGTALSIHHGLYPHVTSRETSVAGCLADAGISPRRVRRVIMVVRTYPIRVGNPIQGGGTSGWMGREIAFEEVSRRSGVPLDEVLETEKGSVSGRLRRIAEFDWAHLRRAAEINGANDVALTFADYLGIANRQAASFADLNSDTQEFIRKVDRVSGASVSLVSKAFALDGVLERGSWN